MNFKDYQNDKLSIDEMLNAKGGVVNATLGKNIIWTGVGSYSNPIVNGDEVPGEEEAPEEEVE
jgi:hypothetical protein